MEKPIPINPGAKAREQARHPSFWTQPVAPTVPPPLAQGNGGVQGGGSPGGGQLFVWAFAVTLLILVMFAVIFLVAHALLSAAAPPAASLLPSAWLGQEGGVGSFLITRGAAGKKQGKKPWFRAAPRGV